MKRILSTTLLLALCATSLFAQGTTKVRGYVKKDGTVVAPHTRTLPNKTKDDNWSTRGNVNPNTGKPGTKRP